MVRNGLFSTSTSKTSKSRPVSHNGPKNDKCSKWSDRWENNFGRVLTTCIFCIFGQLWRTMTPEPFEIEGSNLACIETIYLSAGMRNIILLSLLLTEILIPKHGQKSTFFTFRSNLTHHSACTVRTTGLKFHRLIHY
jgi:hypothetical protein